MTDPESNTPDRESRKPEKDGHYFPSSLIDDSNFLDMLSAQIALQASEIVDSQAARVRTRTALASGLFFLAAATGVALYFEVLENSIKSSARTSAKDEFEIRLTESLNGSPNLESAVLSIVDDPIKILNGKIEDLLSANRVTRAINIVTEGDGFTHDQAKTVLELMLGLPVVEDSTLFNLDEALRTVTLAFAQADRLDFIQELEAKFGEKMTADPQIVLTVSQQTGLELASVQAVPTNPNSLSNKLYFENEAAFTRYRDAAIPLGLQAVPFAFELIKSTIGEISDEELRQIAQPLQTMDEDDFNAIAQVFDTLVTGSWHANGLAASQVAIGSENAKNAIRRYADLEIHAIFEILDSIN